MLVTIVHKLTVDGMLKEVALQKVIGFGGDRSLPVENVYGLVTMAKENLAIVLAKRVERGLATVEEAVGIARRWLYENPKELYRLDA